jgi:ABC-type antimicrobial peptide transport system permease subunit
MQQEVLKKDLSNNPDILSLSITGQNILSGGGIMGFWNWEGKVKGDDVLLYHLYVDDMYAKAFQLEMKEGRFFSSTKYSTDTTAVVINEKAAEFMGFKDPIGKIILSPKGSKFNIIGVVKNFNYRSLHTVIEPLIIHMQAKGSFCYIKMKPDHRTSTIKYINKTVKSYNLPYPQNFTFLDDEYFRLYANERLIGTLLGYITFLVIIISCLGLLGLSTFMTLQRTKEIGIRKANGAKTIEIFSLLSKEYVKLVSISFLIASPIAWYAMNIWLQSFAYRTNIGWWVFALTWLIVFVITMLTVGFQSYKAARKNPVDALGYE